MIPPWDVILLRVTGREVSRTIPARSRYKLVDEFSCSKTRVPLTLFSFNTPCFRLFSRKSFVHLSPPYVTIAQIGARC